MYKITILGMNKNADKLTCLKDKKVILRTKICDASKVLDDIGVEYITLDNIYDDAKDFDMLDKMLADEVIRIAKEEEVLYIVPGSAVTLDGSVNEIFKSYNDVEILAGDAPEYDLFSNCKHANASCGYAVIPAGCLEEGMFSPRLPLVVTALDNNYLLSDIKILLSDEYGDEHDVIIGDKKGYQKIKIYEMDRYQGCDHNTMVYVPVRTKQARYDIHELQNVFRKLRSPEGCPWDREQTHKSIKRNLLEECAEVLDAIDNDDMAELCDELGDVLLQVVFHSTMAEERGDFELRDVCDNLARKLIKRHPHVFSDAVAQNSDEVKKIWESVKHDDKEDKSITHKLQTVPRSMSALMRAQKVLSRAVKAEFLEDEYKDDLKNVLTKISGGIENISKATENEDKEKMEIYLGDMLFNISNAARMLKIESEMALNGSIKRFIDDFGSKEKEFNK